jgi:hypothetical protein
MILTSRLNFFDKKGNELNLQPDLAVTVTVVEPATAATNGYGASFEVFTNREGHIAALEIQSGGFNYDPSGQTFLRFTNINGYVWDSDPADLSIDLATGTITGFDGLTYTGFSDWKTGNSGFQYPATSWKGETYFDRVSTGLVENQSIFITEKMIPLIGESTGAPLYSYPRADEGPKNWVGSFSSTRNNVIPNNSDSYSGRVTVMKYSFTANSSAGDDKIYAVSVTSPVITLEVGMVLEGTNVPAGTTILEIINSTTIRTSHTFTANGPIASLQAYKKHGFVAGMKIRIANDTNPIAINGVFDVTQVSDTSVFFQTNSDIGIIANTIFATEETYFRAVPQWKGSVLGVEPEIFLFTVTYGEDYPYITKSESLMIPPVDGDYDVNFTNQIADFYTLGSSGSPVNDNELQYRIAAMNVEEKMMQYHFGFSAGTEGVYNKLFVLQDVTFPYNPILLAQVFMIGEAEGEDARLGRLLQNFGRDVTETQELIMRDSNVYEDLPDYSLLNKKRKEMLLQGDEIWPYMGSYKGIVNIVNWFGYYDLRIKEYWLNVNKDDVYYGKYKQIQIPFQLQERGVPYSSIGMLPNKVYKKTNKFGLFYDLNKENGVLDENGVPLTIDAFQYSNEEVLIKLFALKQYLSNNFLPLSARIVDIVGEGVYYERYAANTWNDRVQGFEFIATRNVDFTADEDRVKLIDAREYDSTASAKVMVPGQNTIGSFYSTYNITGITINSSAAFDRIPNIILSSSTSASPSQIWQGSAYVTAFPGTYTLSGNSVGGSGYAVNDIIVLNGGVFSNPIRLRVAAVTGGSVTSVTVLNNLNQDSRYLQLPQAFSQLSSLTYTTLYGNAAYVSGSGTGFKLAYDDINYSLEGVKTTTIGKGYPVLSNYTLTAIDPVTSATPAITYDIAKTLVPGPKVGYFDGVPETGNTNESGAPVAAFVDLTALGFEVTWDEMAFSWNDLWSAEDGSLNVYIDDDPITSGAVLAVEIVSQGSGYSLTPSIEFVGGDGIGATAVTKLENGKLQIIEATATSISVLSPTTSRIFTTFNVAPQTQPYNVGSMVVGDGIPKPTVITNVDPVGAYIDVTSFTTNFSNPSPQTIYVHEGARLTAGGNGYLYSPGAKIYGGHTSVLYTWDEIGRGNFYEMEWKVDSEYGTPTFTYTSGRSSIDNHLNHRVALPYKGFYRVELIVYDTDNNWVNEIKRNYIEVYMPEAISSYATRFIGPSYKPGLPHKDGNAGSDSNILQLEQNCVDTWDEGIFMWDEFWGRWVNPIKTWTAWDDCDILWDSLYVSPLSRENNWNFPVNPLKEVYRVSAYDNKIGNVSSFNSATPSVIIALTDEQARPLPQAGEWIFFRRDGNTFQGEVVSSSITGTNITIVLDSGFTWPQNFEVSPTSWECLREIGNTVIIKDDLYTPDNGKTLTPGQYVRLQGNNDTPLNNSRTLKSQPPYKWGIPINSKIADPISGDDSGIELLNFANDSFVGREWVNGQIYKYRNLTGPNGNLLVTPWPTNSAVTTAVTLEKLESPTEFNWGNRAMFYINTSGSGTYVTTADPLTEIRPGFTEISLIVGEANEYYTELRSASLSNSTQEAKMVARDTPSNKELWVYGNGVTVDIVNTVTMTTTSFTVAGPGTIDGMVYVPGADCMYCWEFGSNRLTRINCASLAISLVVISNAQPASTGANPLMIRNVSYIGGTVNKIYVFYFDPAFTSGPGIAGLSVINPSTNLQTYERTYTGTATGPFYNATNYVNFFGTANLSASRLIIGNNVLPGYYAINLDPTTSNVSNVSSASFPLYGPGTLKDYAESTVNFWFLAANSSMQMRLSKRPNLAWSTATINTTLLNRPIPKKLAYNANTNSLYVSYENTGEIEVFPLSSTSSGQTPIAPVQYEPSTISPGMPITDLTYCGSNVYAAAVKSSTGERSVIEISNSTEFVPTSVVYEQHFRTINMYEVTSNQGHPWDIWSDSPSSVVAIEAATIDGKEMNELEGLLQDYLSNGYKTWIEYKYDVFPTRTFSSANSLSNLEITMDFNTHPIYPAFESSTQFPADTSTGEGWYYDHGISEGDFSLRVENVGQLGNTGWSILTLNDDDQELYRCDSTFEESATDFDEDYAETHLGTKTAWDEAVTLNWENSCSQTWTTLDWNYTLPASTRIAVDDDSNYAGQTIQFNEDIPYEIDLSGCPPDASVVTTYMSDLLNNNFYDPTGTIKRNENPGLSKFYYNVEERDGQHIYYGVFSWGNPANNIMFGDTSSLTGLLQGSSIQAEGIQPGWYVFNSSPTSILIGATSAAVGSRPWIPACVIHGNLESNSRVITNIVGYRDSLPLGGYIYDPNTSSVIGEFGPNIGQIVRENGFVKSITLDQVAGVTSNYMCLEVYPYRSSLVKIVRDSGLVNANYYVTVQGKTPGTDLLGYTNLGLPNIDMSFYQNYAFITQNKYSNGGNTLPLGNFFNWVKDWNSFYGGSLDSSLLQFAAPYRAPQVFLQESGQPYNPSFENYTNDEDYYGFYARNSWNSYNFETFRPKALVKVYNSAGVEVLFSPSADITITEYDDFCFITPLTTTVPAVSSGDYLKIYIADTDGDGESQSFECVLVDKTRGILGKTAVYFSADYSEDPALIYDYNKYELTNVVVQTSGGTLYEGMYLGNTSTTTFFENSRTAINSVNDNILYTNGPQIAGSGSSSTFYAYVPLSLPFKFQPTNSKIWSRTKQWQSMRLLYEDSINSAFTWEDSTIGVAEKKIPAGASVLFTSDASDIAGKTSYRWNLYHDGTKVCSVIDPSFLWTFMETGLYDLELSITDSNGNTQTKYNPNYLEVYLAN